jgi:glycosyltransferase involved in cell wall biosynthesis
MNNKMKEGSIAFYCRSDLKGGIERNIISMVLNCNEMGINTIVIASENSLVSNALEVKGIEIYKTRSNEKRLGIRSIRHIQKYLVDNETKAFFVFKPNEIFIGALIKIFSGLKIKLVYYQQVGLNFEKNAFLYSILFKWVDKWITPVSYIRSEALEHYWSRKKKIDVINHSLNLELFTNNSFTREQARKKLDLPLNAKIIGILGRHNPVKNQDFLIRAINFLKLNNYVLNLLIMGEPKVEEEKVYSGFLRELMCECNLQDQVYFRSYSEDKITFIRAVDIFVMTTTGEACDVSLIESMAAGTPVIAVNSKYNSEILENGNLGLLFRENDMADFSAKAIKLLNQNKLYDFLQFEARKAALEKYDIKSKCHKFEMLVHELLKKK